MRRWRPRHPWLWPPRGMPTDTARPGRLTSYRRLFGYAAPYRAGWAAIVAATLVDHGAVAGAAVAAQGARRPRARRPAAAGLGRRVAGAPARHRDAAAACWPGWSLAGARHLRREQRPRGRDLAAVDAGRAGAWSTTWRAISSPGPSGGRWRHTPAIRSATRWAASRSTPGACTPSSTCCLRARPRAGHHAGDGRGDAAARRRPDAAGARRWRRS